MRESFRKVGLGMALLSMVALGGCAGTTAASIQNTVSTIEAEVQADANVLCGFIPTAATIAAFIPGFGAIAASAATIAEGVCQAVAQAPVVKTQSMKRSAAAGAPVDSVIGNVRTPNGVVSVAGHFTR